MKSHSQTRLALLVVVMLTLAASPSSASNEPLDPTRLDCSHTWFSSVNTARSLLSWSRDSHTKAANWSDFHSYPVNACLNALKLRGSAACKAAGDPMVQQAWQETSRVCRAWFRRYKIFKKARARCGSKLTGCVPKEAYSPAQVERYIKASMRWAAINSLRVDNYPTALLHYREVLRFVPSHSRAIDGYERIYMAYWGVTRSVARTNRLQNAPLGRLSRMPQAELYKIAVDELLGKHHSVSNGVPRLGLSYLDVHYLAIHLFEPLILRSMSRFRELACSRLLASRGQDFRDPAVKQALTGGVCSRAALRIKPIDIFDDIRIRMELIRILAEKIRDGDKVLRQAAAAVALQSGASRVKVCWLYENPYPEQHRPTAGPGAHCSRWGSDRGNNVRPGYYNYVYQPKPMGKMTRIEILHSRKVLAMGKAAGTELDRKLEKAFQRAKGHKCVAIKVTLGSDLIRPGRWSALEHSSVGTSDDINCGRVSRKGPFKKIYSNWNSFFDTVLGGRFVGGWDVTRSAFCVKRDRNGSCRRYRVLPSRRTRDAVVYIQRKI